MTKADVINDLGKLLEGHDVDSIVTLMSNYYTTQQLFDFNKFLVDEFDIDNTIDFKYSYDE